MLTEPQQRILLKEIDDFLGKIQKHTSLIVKLQASNGAEQLDLFVKNNGGFSVSAQISVQTGCNFGHLHELNFTVSAGATSVFGPFETQRFNTNESKVTWIYLADSSSTQLLAISI
jgi:hypothetical protein